MYAFAKDDPEYVAAAPLEGDHIVGHFERFADREGLAAMFGEASSFTNAQQIRWAREERVVASGGDVVLATRPVFVGDIKTEIGRDLMRQFVALCMCYHPGLVAPETLSDLS